MCTNALDLHNKVLNEKLRVIRTERYACQSVARLAVPKERVSMCLRKINGNLVEVYQHRKTQKAFYNGLLVCGSVWTCPVCAAKISERRKKEIKQAFDMHKSNGGKISMLTLTFSHKKTDKLKDTIKLFGQATTKFMSGKAFNNIRLQLGLIGRIRVYEVTYGVNGYHPHVHIALFHTNDFKPIEWVRLKNRLYDLWEQAIEKVGLTTSRKYGLDLQQGEHAEAYLSKHGTWSLEQELSKAHIKKAKNDSMTPFDFLRKYLECEDKKYLSLFREYVECFKGKRQIQWSQGLKKMFVLEEKTDEQVATEVEEEADILGRINFEGWKKILRMDYRAKFLDHVENYGFENALEILENKKESSGNEDSQVKEI